MQGENHRNTERVLQILECFANKKNSLSLHEICQLLDVPKSSIFSVLKTMVNMGYLTFENSKYSVGIRFFETFLKFVETQDGISMLNIEISKLRDITDETSHFAILRGSEAVYVAKKDSKQTIKMSSSIGKSLPAHATALGKCILSGLDEKDLKKMYNNYEWVPLTNNTITNFDDLKESIEIVKKTGFCFEYEESSENVMCIAVPICNKNGQIKCGLSVAFPSFRESHDKNKLIQEELIIAKHKIESILKLYQFPFL